jgi:hypothetical protein
VEKEMENTLSFKCYLKKKSLIFAFISKIENIMIYLEYDMDWFVEEV